jgi:hypothetical protein
MKEEVAKNLIQKSKIHTSADFTERLLLRIEAEKTYKGSSIISERCTYYYVISGLTAIVAIFFAMGYYGYVPKFSFGNFQLTLNKTFFMVLTIFSFLIGINQLLRLRENAVFQREVSS